MHRQRNVKYAEGDRPGTQTRDTWYPGRTGFDSQDGNIARPGT